MDEQTHTEEGSAMDARYFNTTVGDLIVAISDAALEARIDEKDIASITSVVLRDILATEEA